MNPLAGIARRMFASTERIELAALWDELIAGSCKIESWSHAEESWSMVISRRPKPSASAGMALRQRDIEILERALLSGGRKQVAVEAGLSCSSIAVIMQSCFQFMGLSCLPSRIPGLLVAAAHARHHQGAKFQSYLSGKSAPLFAQQTIRVARPDAGLDAWLAPAEHAVIHLLIEGMSYAEIAQARHTSVRTVANQVASGFRRLDVSGRAELLCLLARWGLTPPVRPARRPPSIPAPTTRRTTSRRASRGGEAGQSPHCLSPSPAT
jgi:DNA-binding CsgD family transcriptional regulator